LSTDQKTTGFPGRQDGLAAGEQKSPVSFNHWQDDPAKPIASAFGHFMLK
jgi:hypothetical protein